MLKFFRRIRRKLIDEGNLKRYLMYAIGEILLVMIGILLALQVNNWSETKKSVQIERELLKVINTNLQGERKRLNSVVSQSRVIMAKAQHLISGNIDSLSLETLYRDITRVNPHYHFNTGYEILVNSKNVNHIKNKKLLQEIMLFYGPLYRKLDGTAHYDQEIIQHKLEPYYLKNIPIDQSQFKVTEILMKEIGGIQFRNLLLEVIHLEEAKIYLITKEVFVSMDKLEELLDEELSD